MIAIVVQADLLPEPRDVFTFLRVSHRAQPFIQALTTEQLCKGLGRANTSQQMELHVQSCTDNRAALQKAWLS